MTYTLEPYMFLLPSFDCTQEMEYAVEPRYFEVLRTMEKITGEAQKL